MLCCSPVRPGSNRCPFSWTVDSSTDFAITFFTILTVLANVAALGIGAAALVARLAPTAPLPQRVWATVRGELGPTVALGLALLVAVVSTAGSLYFSEGAGFTPCRLCWVQRGFMYPLVAVLAVALGAAVSAPGGAIGRWVRRVAGALAGVGAAVAVWHRLIEMYPSLEGSATCDPSTPCSLVWFERLGFVTLPYMALSGFVLILALVVMAATGERRAVTGKG